MEKTSNIKEVVKVVKTDADLKNGQDKCPKCGATDISLNCKKGLLRCKYCRYEFGTEKVEGLVEDVTTLEGKVVGSAIQDIKTDVENMITLRCSSCGAEVVIDANETTHVRCHWCRNVLTMNQQIPNGMIPDVILPFKLSKEEAKTKMEELVKKRKFFIPSNFKKELTIENVMGVYFPYLVVDVNLHASFKGNGEHLIRNYKRIYR